MPAVPALVPAGGVNVAIRVRPEPEIAPRVPPVTTTSPDEPFQVNVAPGCSLKVKVTGAVWPIFSRDTSLVIASVGGVVSIVTVNGEEATETLPAASVAVAVTPWVPAVRVLVVMLQLPAVAVAVPSTVVPSVS